MSKGPAQDFIEDYSANTFTYSKVGCPNLKFDYLKFQEQTERDIERGSELIIKFIGNERLKNVTGRRDFTDDSSDRQNSSETTD